MPISICQTCGSILRADTSVCSACETRINKAWTEATGIAPADTYDDSDLLTVEGSKRSFSAGSSGGTQEVGNFELPSRGPPLDTSNSETVEQARPEPEVSPSSEQFASSAPQAIISHAIDIRLEPETQSKQEKANAARNAETNRAWGQGNFFDTNSHKSPAQVKPKNQTEDPGAPASAARSSTGSSGTAQVPTESKTAMTAAASSIETERNDLGQNTVEHTALKAAARKKKLKALSLSQSAPGRFADAEKAIGTLLENSSLSEARIRSFGKIFVIVGICALAVLSVLLFLSFLPELGSILSKNSDNQPAPQSAGNQSEQTSSSNQQRFRAGNILSGTWSLDYKNQLGKIGRGRMSIEQRAQQIAGHGVDEFGEFQISGAASNSNINFSKYYVQNGQRVGKLVRYSGQLSLGQDGQLRIDGNWTISDKQNQQESTSASGAFRAMLLHAGYASSEQQTQQLTMQQMALQYHASKQNLINNQPGQSTVQSDPDPKKSHSFFMQVALGIIGIGVALAMISLKFFGPSGLLNIWAKKEYIPSQFKSQHLKMVSEMGKAAGPGSLPLGKRDEWGWHQFWLPRELAIPPELRARNPHFFIIGGGAAGKSRLMAAMIAHDIQSNDRAVVLVDSDGGLADLILDWIASRPDGAKLSKRVLIVDPTFNGDMFNFNPIEFPKDGDLQNAASAIVFGFKAAYTEAPGAQSQWNQQTANILRNAAVLLMANDRTLADLPLLLADNDFRDVMLEKVERIKQSRSEYITLVDAWTNYKRLARTDQWITWIEPILNRVQPMLSDPRCRRILTAPRSDLNLTRVIKEKKVLVVKLPQGQLDKNGNLLGSLMVAGIKQAALSLSVQHNVTHFCSLYLDEFETFIEKETFDTITSETRKLQLGLCGASKTFQTLPEDFRNNIIINVGTMAIFALAKKDADMLGPQMFRVDGRKVKHQTIQNVFNKVNTSPQFELISDEEKLNIDRVVGQERRTYFCYRVGSVAGVFRMIAPEFPNIPQSEINEDLLERMYSNRLSQMDATEDDAEDDDC